MIRIPDPETAREVGHRMAFAQGLREIAAAVIADPNFPVPDFPRIAESATGDSDEAEREFVRRAAAAMGVEPSYTSDEQTHFVAVRKFGPIEYSVTAITRAHMKRYRAESTYRGVIEP